MLREGGLAAEARAVAAGAAPWQGWRQVGPYQAVKATAIVVADHAPLFI